MRLDLIAVALAAIAMWRVEPRSRAVGLLAALVMGVAAASLQVFSGAEPERILRGDFAVDATGLVVLTVITGLVLLGLVLGLAARPGPVSVIVVGAGAWLASPLLRWPGLNRSVGVAAGVVAVSTVGWWLLRRLRPGRLLLWLDRFLDPVTQEGARSTPALPPFLASAVFVLLAIAVPHLWTVLGGSALALIACWVAVRGAGWRTGVLLVAALFCTIALLWSVRLAGPLGGWIPSLVDGPFSPRAALLLALLVAGAAWIASGSWPLHGRVPALTMPLVIPLAGTFGVLLIPDGLRYWQPLLAPVTILGMLHAVAHRRLDRLMVSVALLGFWTATIPGATGGVLLTASAVALVLLPTAVVRRHAPPRLVAVATQLVPAVGLLLVLRGHLATEVAYGLVAAWIGAAAIGLMGADAAGTKAARLHPSGVAPVR